MSYKTDSWWDLLFYVIGVAVVVLICLGISLLFTYMIQTKMDGGLIIDKYLVEGHYETYSYYDSESKRSSVRTRWIPTKYTLVVQKEIKGKVKVKEVPVNIEKYYDSEIGSIYNR
jgi:hypothetical protein